jgi:hypothetical protein
MLLALMMTGGQGGHPSPLVIVWLVGIVTAPPLGLVGLGFGLVALKRESGAGRTIAMFAVVANALLLVLSGGLAVKMFL